MRDDKIIEPYFSHDISSRQDSAILRLLMKLGWEGYGLFWAIVEYMHKNQFAIEDEPLIAYELRAKQEKIHQIMNDFGLFKKVEGYYISDRILRNLNYVEQKNEDKKQAANVRWLLSTFNKAYLEFFDEEPILSSEEIETLKNYNEKIDDLKGKIRDIIYTLKNLKFDTKSNFKPCANWLLKDNNLARLVNGEFGPLKHKKTQKEIKEEEKQQQIARNQKKEPSELDSKIMALSTREETLNFIFNYYKDSKITFWGNKAYIIPSLRPVMKRFGITDEELKGLQK